MVIQDGIQSPQHRHSAVCDALKQTIQPPGAIPGCSLPLCPAQMPQLWAMPVGQCPTWTSQDVCDTNTLGKWIKPHGDIWMKTAQRLHQLGLINSFTEKGGIFPLKIWLVTEQLLEKLQYGVPLGRGAFSSWGTPSSLTSTSSHHELKGVHPFRSALWKQDQAYHHLL